MSQEKICPTCGREYPANERFCPADGTALRSQGGGNDLVGSIIAERYHVLKKLGEGGMGQVYLAEHVKMGRKSAVKVMNPGMVHDADAISRFNREAANASRINHPNVAGIYDFGETAEGLIYLAMEFIEGESLTSLVEKNGALAPMRAADIAKQAADGLAVAHDMGIVHRDLKPDNIMIAKNRDGSDCVKVVDFGIAKAAGAENQKVTKTGLVVGTPEYMSPEQLAGDKLDGRSDIYSLALVSYNMLTGKLPFEGETAQESMIMRLTDDPKPLSFTKPDTSWSKEVQDVMAKALQRKRDDRYAKASDFGVALFQAVERMPKTVRPSATQMIGAMDGATAVLSAPPPTRVDASAPSAPPPAARTIATPATSAPVVAPKKSMVPVFGGVGALAVIGVAAFMFMSKSGGAGVKPDSAAVTPSAAVGAPTGMVTQPQVQQAAGSQAQTQTTTQGAPPPVRPGNPQTSNGIPPATRAAEVDIATRLPALYTESSEDATAARALKEAEALAPKAVRTSDIIGLSLVRAQAHAMLGHDKQTCDLLDAIKERGANTQWNEKIQLLLKACP